jgi:hypothetical protein
MVHEKWISVLPKNYRSIALHAIEKAAEPVVLCDKKRVEEFSELGPRGRWERWIENKTVWDTCGLRFLVSDCAPPWSIKLPIASAPETKHVQLIDKRPSEEREFRFVDFTKLSYKSYLADTNTSPNRVTFCGLG